jgi:hypothetical protein
MALFFCVLALTVLSTSICLADPTAVTLERADGWINWPAGFPLSTEYKDINLIPITPGGNHLLFMPVTRPTGARQASMMLWNGAMFVDETAARFNIPVGEQPDTYDADFFDIDGDGDQDIVYSSPYGNKLFINNGSGVFANETTARFPAIARDDGVTVWDDVVTGDIDGDGDMDIVFSSRTFPLVGDWSEPRNWGPNILLYNDGNGYFNSTPSSVWQFGRPSDDDPDELEGNSHGIKLADLNNNGRLDMVVSHSWDYVSNDGAGELLDFFFNQGDTDGNGIVDWDHQTHALSNLLANISTLDYDNDGDIDIFLVSAWGRDRLLRGDGTGSFTDAGDDFIEALSNTSYDAAVGDINDDGYLDIAVAQSDGFANNSNSLLLNDGGNAPFRSSDALINDEDNKVRLSVAFADVDNDGDLETIWGSDSRNPETPTVFRNTNINADNQAPRIDTPTLFPMASPEAAALFRIRAVDRVIDIDELSVSLDWSASRSNGTTVNGSTPLTFAAALTYQSPISCTALRNGLAFGDTITGFTGTVEATDRAGNTESFSITDVMNVAAGLSDGTGSGVSIDIVEPTEFSPTAVQPTDGTGRLLIRVSYRPLDLIPNQDDFEVLVGGSLATVITGGRVGSQYWLVVETPTGIEATSSVQVRYRFCNVLVEDTEFNAVPFGDPRDSDTVLVIDTSGSMNADRKLESAQNAAVLFINTLRDGERIGVVEYSGELASGYGRTDEVFDIDVAAGNRGPAETEVRNLTGGDTTPLGEGLLRGLAELNDVIAAQRNDVRSLILLSDGKENVPNYWAEPPVGHYSPPEPSNTPVVNTFTAAPNNEIRIHTVSLGPDADPDLMADIASGRGIYRHADVITASPESGIASLDFPFLVSTAYADTDISALDLPLRLSNLYEHLHNETSTQQRLLQTVHITTRTKAPGNDLAGTSDTAAATNSSGGNIIQLPIEPGLSYATISVNWTKPAGKNLQIVPPAGQDPTSISITRSNTNTVFRIEQPKDGVWKIGNFGGTVGEKLFTTVSGISVEKGIARAIVPSDAYLAGGIPIQGIGSLDPGDPIPFVLALMEEQPVLNATVSAVVRSSANDLELIQLHDDGANGDTNAGDGFYTGTITQTAQGGAFNVEIQAAWTGADGAGRTRIFPLSVSMRELDSDGDSISDQDEIRVGLDPKNPQDGGADSDRDGLPNWKELLFELDPFNPDTDGGGASDGIEVASGGNPLNPDDDNDINKDSDGDGLPDVWEVAFGFDPNDPADANQDPDGDNLTNIDELEHGTSPINPDTDGDQASDGDELESGTDPTDPENRIQPQTSQDEDKMPYLFWFLLLIIIFLTIIILILIYLLGRKNSSP